MKIENLFNELAKHYTEWCEIHRNFVEVDTCENCEFSTCVTCLEVYGCDNCEVK